MGRIHLHKHDGRKRKRSNFLFPHGNSNNKKAILIAQYGLDSSMICYICNHSFFDACDMMAATHPTDHKNHTDKKTNEEDAKETNHRKGINIRL